MNGDFSGFFIGNFSFLFLTCCFRTLFSGSGKASQYGDLYVSVGSNKTIKEIKPDIFIVNSDDDSVEKCKFVENLGIRYVVSNRISKDLLPVRSTTAIQKALGK